MKKLLFLLFAQLIICSTATGEIQDTKEQNGQPNLPTGYSWCEVPLVPVSIPKPDGWYVSEPEVENDNFVFTLSREAPEKGFHTGLTLNIVRNVKEKTKLPPSLYAVHFVGQRQKSGKQIEIFDLVQLAENIKRCGITVEQEMTVQKVTQLYTIHYTIFANDKTGKLYIFIFGTPSNKWKEDKKIWNTMRNIKLNPEF